MRRREKARLGVNLCGRSLRFHLGGSTHMRLGNRLGILLFVFGMLFGVAWATQVHMSNAMHDLQSAAYELNQAAPDKGGHRVQAVNLVNQAIQQVKWGMQYAQ